MFENTTPQMVTAYQNKRLAEAGEYWDLEPHRVAIPSFSRRMLGQVGLLMISAGHRLVEYHTPVLHASREQSPEAQAKIGV